MVVWSICKGRSGTLAPNQTPPPDVLAVLLEIVLLNAWTSLERAPISPSYASDAISCDSFEGCADGSTDVTNQLLQMQAEIEQLKALLAGVSRGVDPNTSQDTLTFTNMNVQVVNGSGSTGEATGTGNLIIGYNEMRGVEDDRTGSHMLVIGRRNNYSSYGGMVVGWENTASGGYASVSGGSFNTAGGTYASVSGGFGNEASGQYASILGGNNNQARGERSTVLGGFKIYAWSTVPYGIYPRPVDGGGNIGSYEKQAN